jgi:type II secretory pathway pseudopilin PulG
MTLVEIVVVAGVVSVVSAGAMASMSAIAGRQRVARALDQVLLDVQQQRSAHVAAGREELLAMCVDCIDDTGAAQTPTNPHVLNVYLMDDPLKPETGRPAFRGRYDDVTLSIAGTAPHVAVDALGRSVACDTRAPLDVKLVLGIDENRRESIGFDGDGKLSPSFAEVIEPLPPHAQNLSAPPSVPCCPTMPSWAACPSSRELAKWADRTRRARRGRRRGPCPTSTCAPPLNA